MIHKEILTANQIKFLPLLELFSKNFGLVGGTAIALHIGHRQSIDFDMFSFEEFNNSDIKRKILKRAKIDKSLVNKRSEFTFFIKDVKFTFYNFPYKINFSKKIDGFIKMPDLLTLAAMKAFALGQRAKWKDYVDLYFIMKDYHSIGEIVKKGKQLFGNEFNEKLFRVQLSYFKDMNYSEKVAYMKGFETEDKIIEKALIDFSLS